MSDRPLSDFEQLLLEDPWSIVDDDAPGDDDAGVGETPTYARRWFEALARADGSADPELWRRIAAARKRDRRARRLESPPLPPDHPARMLADTGRGHGFTADPEVPDEDTTAARSPLDAVALARTTRIVTGRSPVPVDELTALDQRFSDGAYATVAAAAEFGPQVARVRTGHADVSSLYPLAGHADILGVRREYSAFVSGARWGAADVDARLQALLDAVERSAASWIAQLVIVAMQHREGATVATLTALAAVMPEAAQDDDDSALADLEVARDDHDPPERAPALVDQLTSTLLVSPGAPQGHTTGDPIPRVPPVVLAA